VVKAVTAVARVPNLNRGAVTVASASVAPMVDTVEVPSKVVLIMVLTMVPITVLMVLMVSMAKAIMVVVDSDTALVINNRLLLKANMSGATLPVMAAMLNPSVVFAITAPSAKILTCARIVKAEECTPVIIL